MKASNVTKPHRAIILSAGQGSRLLPLTEKMPKCLIDLGGRSMLEWQLRALDQMGVAEAVVVTGFFPDLVEAELNRVTLTQLRVRTLYNPFYKLADNLASCWMARAELSGPCMILNGDTLFEPEIAGRLLAAPSAPITVTIDRKAAYDADDMKVVTEGEHLRAIGKALTADRVNGESIGFLRFDADGAALWYLSAINRLANAGADVRVVSIEGLQWGELDFPVDLVQVRELASTWDIKKQSAPVTA